MGKFLEYVVNIVVLLESFKLLGKKVIKFVNRIGSVVENVGSFLFGMLKLL